MAGDHLRVELGELRVLEAILPLARVVELGELRGTREDEKGRYKRG